MNLAVDKAKEAGIGVVGVRNSHHFGAAGVYARIAAKRGAIGMVTSATRGVAMVPTRGAMPVLGTNPIAFAAPAKRNRHFVLDMATTTTAAGKVKVYDLNERQMPSGWVLDGKGQPVTDPIVLPGSPRGAHCSLCVCATSISTTAASRFPSSAWQSPR